MIFLRQSTASQEVPLGDFLDSTDGNTEKTALTIANTDIKLWKTGATSLASKNSGGATHIANGRYYAVLDATDTDTIGPMVIFVHVAGALAVRLECCVLDEAVFDTVFGTTALSTYAGGDTSGVTTLLSRISSALTITTGKVDVNDKTGFSLTSAYDPAKTAAQAGDAMALTSGERTTLTGVIWAALTSGLTTVGSIGKRLVDNLTGDAYARLGAPVGASISADIAGVQSDTDNIQTRLPVSLVSGRMDSSVGAMAADVITDTALAASGVTEIQSGLSTYAGGDTSGTTTLLSRLTSGRASNLDNLDATISGIAAAVWGYVTRTLSAFGFSVTAATVSDKTGYALTSSYDPAKTASQAGDAMALTASERASVADKLLGRNLAGGSDGGRTVQDAMRTLRNKVTIVGTTVTVYEEDDTTPAFTATITTDPAAEPITAVDPS